MCGNLSDLKNELKKFVKAYGAYDVRVADANRGFENAIPGCRPRDVMEDCNSVVAFALYVGPDYYRALKMESKVAGEDRIMHIFRDWLQHKVAEFLREKGQHAIVPTGHFNREKLICRFPTKLSAYEAGLGVYGRCGIIITPEYGPRVNLGVVLTEANLEADDKLTGFSPCLKCRLCADSCPPKAIREDISPPMSHNRDRCINFVLSLREKTRDQHFYCGYCYESCPVGKTDKPGFRLSRYRNLFDLADEERDRLINEVINASF